MDYNDLRYTVESTIENGWTSTPIHYENTPFSTNSAGWISINILNAASQPETVGTGGYDRFYGLVSIIVYSPEDTGTKTILDSGKTIGELFRRKTISGVTFGAYTIRKVTSSHEGYYCVAVDIPFWFFG